MNSGCTVYSMHLIGCLNINQEVDPYPVSKLFLFILGVSTGLSVHYSFWNQRAGNSTFLI